MSERCNHVAGLLFRVEHTVATGATSVTSSAASWPEPKKSMDIDVKRPLRDFMVNYYKMTYGKAAPTRYMFTQRRNEFQPIGEERRRRYGLKTAKSFTSRVKEHQPNVLAGRYDEDPLASQEEPKRKAKKTGPTTRPDDAPASAPRPKTVQQVLEAYLADADEPTGDGFLHALQEATTTDAAEIETITRQQGSDIWREYRKHRVTASVLYGVYTRQNTIDKKGAMDVGNTVRTIRGDAPPRKTADMLYGNLHEKDGREAYIRQMRADGHQLEVNPSGLVVVPDVPHLGASPDGLVKCNCCGDGVLEVKCPPSLEQRVPRPENISFMKDGHLKKKHPYYGQLLANMALTRRAWADLVVWTPLGIHRERVPFDEDDWTAMRTQVTRFYMEQYCPDLLRQPRPAPTRASSSRDTPPVPSPAAAPEPEAGPVPAPKGKGKAKASGGKKTAVKPAPKPRKAGSKCPLCRKPVLADPNYFEEQHMACYKCHSKYHFGCLGYQEADDVPDDEEYTCAQCRSEAGVERPSRTLSIKN